MRCEHAIDARQEEVELLGLQKNSPPFCGNPQDTFDGFRRLYNSHLGDGLDLWQVGSYLLAFFGEVIGGLPTPRGQWLENGSKFQAASANGANVGRASLRLVIRLKSLRQQEFEQRRSHYWANEKLRTLAFCRT
jgi:hypothetical protein